MAIMKGNNKGLNSGEIIKFDFYIYTELHFSVEFTDFFGFKNSHDLTKLIRKKDKYFSLENSVCYNYDKQ
jgi:hypothetical protein